MFVCCVDKLLWSIFCSSSKNLLINSDFVIRYLNISINGGTILYLSIRISVNVSLNLFVFLVLIISFNKILCDIVNLFVISIICLLYFL